MSRYQSIICKQISPAIVVALFAIAPLAYRGEAQQPGKAVSSPASPLVPIVSQAVNFVITDAVSDLPDASGTDDTFVNGEGIDKNELNTMRVKTPNASASKVPSVDAALRGAPTPTSAPSGPLVTFEGLADADNDGLIGGRVNPSDHNIAVGPRDIVETVNDGFRVYDKTGAPRISPKLISKLFNKLGGICANTDRGDPIVQHDRLSDRWVISQFNFASISAAPFHECIAVSKTSDPTGVYYAYDFVTPGNNFPDYPHLSTWPDAYYMTVNQFLAPAVSFNGTGVYAFDRQKMLVGDPTATYIYFNLDLTSRPEGIFAMQPSDLDGFVTPPAGAPNTFAYLISDEYEVAPFNKDGLRLFDFHADFTTPANSTFLERTESPVLIAAYDPRDPTGRTDIKQPPPATTSDYVDSIGYHVMYRLQYRRLSAASENLVLGLTVNVSGVDPSSSSAVYQAGVRYEQLRKTTATGAYSVFDQATFSPDAALPLTGLNRWLPSAAIDNQGNLAMSYSVSSTTVFPSIRYVGRDGNVAGGALTEATLFSGTGPQLGSGNRWGDYQSLQVDPADDCTFWTVNEYYVEPTGSTFNWHTRIGAFKFPTCTVPAQGTLAGRVTTCDTGAPIAGAFIQISNGFSTATGADGSYSVQLPPGAYTVTVSDPSRFCVTAPPFTVSIINGATAAGDVCLNGRANPLLDPSNPNAVTLSGGNGNGIIDPNECNRLNVQLVNTGCATARGVSAVLSTTTPGVTVSAPGRSPYADIAIDANATNSVPFQFSTSASFVCATQINFTLTTTFNGGTTVSTFSLPSCTEIQATQSVNGSLDPTDPKTTQGRLGRNGVASSCGTQKVCPGPFPPPANPPVANPRSFDTIPFTNGPLPGCAKVTLTSAGGIGLLVSAYSGPVNPADVCANYLGDAGGSGTSTSFSINLAPNQAFNVVVMETSAGTAPTPYTVSVDGLTAPPLAGTGPCNAATVLRTQVTSSSTSVGGAVADLATLTTGTNPTGNITFRLYGPNNSTCGGTPIFTSVATVNGDGVYSSTAFAPTALGTYNWIATYSGDVNNPGVAGACGDMNESFIVTAAPTPTPAPPKVTPSLTTQASAGTTVGNSIRDTATISGGTNPSGSITFVAYGPDDATCGGAPAFTSTVAIGGNGAYQSGQFNPSTPGTYRFVATYNGDAGNNAVVTACADPNESVAVTAPTPTPPPPTPVPPPPTPVPTPVPTPTPLPAAQASNLSTRLRVETGDRIGIGGFIVTGTAPKHVLIRGIGTSLARFGLTDVLADPTLEVRGQGSFGTIRNDNWRDSQEAQIKADGLAPTDDAEAAIDATLPPGAYTALLRGKNNTSGIGMVEIYDLDPAAASKLENLSTRAFVGVGGNIAIAGFVIGPDNARNEKIIVRGLGGSLTQAGLTGVLADPTLELRDGNGVLIIANDNYQDDPKQAAQLTAAGLAPSDPKEAALVVTLPPGVYTALLAGRNDTTGIGLVEIFDRGAP